MYGNLLTYIVQPYLSIIRDEQSMKPIKKIIIIYASARISLYPTKGSIDFSM